MNGFVGGCFIILILFASLNGFRAVTEAGAVNGFVEGCFTILILFAFVVTAVGVGATCLAAVCFSYAVIRDLYFRKGKE